MDGKLRLTRAVNKRRLLIIVVVETGRMVIITAMDRA